MPWGLQDVEKHRSGLSEKGKQRWVEIANATLKSCQERGGTDCDATAIKVANAALMESVEQGEENLLEVVIVNSYINTLPDTCFAIIESGGTKNDDITKPFSLRHFAYKDKDGKLNAQMIRDSLWAVERENIPDSDKTKATEILMKAYKDSGMEKNEKKMGMGMIESFFVEDISLSEASLDEGKREAVFTLIKAGKGTNRTYTNNAVKDVIKLLTEGHGHRMYDGHLRTPGERKVNEWLGTIKEVWEDKIGNDAIIKAKAKIHDDYTWKLMKESPEEIHISMAGKGKVSRNNGEEFAESVTTIRSFDFCERGAQHGKLIQILESETPEGTENNNNKQIIEDIVKDVLKNYQQNNKGEVKNSVAITIKDFLENAEYSDLKNQLFEHWRAESDKSAETQAIKDKVTLLESTNKTLQEQINKHDDEKKQAQFKSEVTVIINESKLPDVFKKDSKFSDRMVALGSKERVTEYITTLLEDKKVMDDVKGSGSEKTTGDKNLEESVVKKYTGKDGSQTILESNTNTRTFRAR